MTETKTHTATDISALEASVREASAEQRALALEMDSIPSKIQAAAHADARAKAQAAREGGTGAAVAAVAAVEDESEVPQLRQREKDLPYLIWAASIRHAALEAELYDAQVKHHEAEAQKARSGLLGLKLDMDEATRKYNERADAVQHAEGAASRLSYYRSQASKRAKALEREYPGV